MKEISHTNLSALRILASTWAGLSGGKQGKSVSSQSQIEEVLSMKNMVNKNK